MPKGYTIQRFYDISIPGIRRPACVKTAEATILPDVTSTHPTITQVHNAWHIAWALSDRASLSPAPPMLSCPGAGQSLATWVPGETVPQNTCDPDASNSGGTKWPQSLINFLMMGLPIIFVALVACCCTVCICRRRKRRRARREDMSPAAQKEQITIE
jgi:hypothetical protein